MSDIEEFHRLTQSISTAMENIAQVVPQWGGALALADVTPGAMRDQGTDGSSGTPGIRSPPISNSID